MSILFALEALAVARNYYLLRGHANNNNNHRFFSINISAVDNIFCASLLLELKCGAEHSTRETEIEREIDTEIEVIL